MYSINSLDVREENNILSPKLYLPGTCVIYRGGGFLDLPKFMNGVVVF